MSRLLKIVLIVIAVFLISMISLCMLGYRMITSSLPQTEGELSLRGLQEPVTVFRDGYHVPHIVAKNSHDLFFAQGFVTAQDRLWQMDVWRRSARGELAAVVGKAGLPADSLARIIGFYRRAQAALPHLPADMFKACDAFTQGVNRYIELSRKKRPVEFLLLDYEPDPWEPADCLALRRWLAWNSGASIAYEIVAAALVERIGFAQMPSLFPGLVHESAPTVQNDFQIFSFLNEEAAVPAGGHAWAVSGTKTATQEPMLASAPITPLGLPSNFYEMRLTGGDFDVSGFSIPGLPGVYFGHNRHIAWSLSPLLADDRDIIQSAASSVRTTSHLETIDVRLDSSVQLTVYETAQGPVISPPGAETTLSLKWTGNSETNDGWGILQINRARNWTEFKAALRHIHIASQMAVYADQQGHIGMQAAGDVPARSMDSGWHPVDEENAWKGLIPFEALPGQYNPPAGYVSWADSPLRSRQGAPIYSLSRPGFRQARLSQMIGEASHLTLMDLKRFQSDTHSLFARDMMSLVRPHLDHRPWEKDLESEAAERLLAWDFLMKPGSAEAAVFQVFLSQLASALFEDELGESLFQRYLALESPPLLAMMNTLTHPESNWIDDKQTQTVEDLTDIVQHAFQASVAYLEKKMGPGLNEWSWGGLRQLTFQHPMGDNPMLATAFNLGPFTLGGSSQTLLCAGHALKDPQTVTWAPACRMIVDLSNPDNTLTVLAPGQSGQPLDEQYRQQAPIFLGGLYHSNLFDTTRVIRAGYKQLTLLPGE